MATRISFACPPSVTAAVKRGLLDVLSSGRFSPDAKVWEFEERFARLHKAKHAIFVNSGTDALRLSLLALKEKHGWRDGAKVVVPSLTFVATVNVILQAGLTPYFVDVGMNDYCLNPENLAHQLNTSTIKDIVAILPVHLFGHPADMPYLITLAKKNGWKILEDSCEHIGNALQGDIACFSTYMAHHVTTGVGGFAITNDDRLNLLIRSYANHGRNVLYIPGYSKAKLSRELLKSRFSYDRIGYSCRGTEFQAVLGLDALDHLDENLRRRRGVVKKLGCELEGLWYDFHIPAIPSNHSWMMFPIVIKEASRIDKYDFCLHLERRGIETRDMMPITNQPCYKALFGTGSSYSVSEEINRRGFYIPCHQGVTDADIVRIRKAFFSYPDVSGKYVKKKT